jgi:Ca-activated chloride channel family protein
VSFAHPLWLAAALLATFAFARLYRVLERRASGQALAYSNLAFALEALAAPRWPAAVLFWAWILGVGALGAALAGPRIWAFVPVKDGSVVLCIDTSGSMRATDIEPTRALAAQRAARAFVDTAPDGARIGIVTFSSSAVVIEAPNAERAEVRTALERIPQPDGATAIGDALALAGGQLPEGGRRVVILMTDGINNRGADPAEVARRLAAAGITVYTVGIGTSGSGELIPGTNEPAEIDRAALQSIAETTGGTYAEVGDAGALEAAFADLARRTVWEKRRVDAAVPFALAGGVLMLGGFLAGFAAGKFP